MRELSVISFTEAGERLSEQLAERLEMEVYLYTGRKKYTDEGKDSPAFFVETSVGSWAGRQMREKRAILFIGACGIAVRAIAPFVADKLHDAPVLVMDEGGKHVIPILSGHVGGGNELAAYIAERTGAEPVITTATDIRKKFAVDLFAERNHLFIVNKEGIARVSSKALAGEEITVSIERGHGIDYERQRAAAEDGQPYVPEGVRLVPYPPKGAVDVAVASGEGPHNAALLLKPKEYVIGLGCRRGKAAEEIGAFIGRRLERAGISLSQVFALASISLKADEPGIAGWCRRERILFFTYTAGELEKAEGNFAKSAFVKERTGTDNVCERAAVIACGAGGELIVPKYAENGMTIAIARRKWRVCFYEP